MWIIVLILSLIAIQLFLIFCLATVKDFMDARRTEKIFADLIENGFSEFDALVEVSHKRHPELSLETHRKIATKFCDVDKFLGFMIHAVDVYSQDLCSLGKVLRFIIRGYQINKKAKLEEKKVLALLETTTLIYKGNGVYTADIDRERYYKILDQN